MNELKSGEGGAVLTAGGLLLTSFMLMLGSLTVPIASGAIGPLYATGAFTGFFYGACIK